MVKRASTLGEESSQAYRFGGYAPITIGQILNGGRYKVACKLGFGQFSTVWLAYDTQKKRYSCLKIMRSSKNYTQAAVEEIQMLKHCRQQARSSQHDGKEHLLRFQHHFQYTSTNGLHMVLVLEVLGESLANRLVTGGALSMPMVKKLTRQMLMAVDFLHTECNLIHTDLKPVNILLTLEGLEEDESMIEDLIRQSVLSSPIMSSACVNNVSSAKQAQASYIIPSTPLTSPVRRRRTKSSYSSSNVTASTSPSDRTDTTAPSTRATSACVTPFASAQTSPLSSPSYSMSCINESTPQASSTSASYFPHSSTYLPDEEDDEEPEEAEELNCKVTDLGNATPKDCHSTEDIQTREYRAPEVILGKPWDEKVDTWSLGCIVFQLVTKDKLFTPNAGHNFTSSEDHLAQMMELLGPMPTGYLDDASNATRFMNVDKRELRTIKNSKLNFWPLIDVFKDKYGMSEEEAVPLNDFLLRMLQFDPKDRSTLKELLSDPFLDSTAAAPARPERSISDENATSTPIAIGRPSGTHLSQPKSPSSSYFCTPSLMSCSLSSTLSPPQLTPVNAQPVLVYVPCEPMSSQGFQAPEVVEW